MGCPRSVIAMSKERRSRQLRFYQSSELRPRNKEIAPADPERIADRRKAAKPIDVKCIMP